MATLLVDQYFTPVFVHKLAQAIQAIYPTFDVYQFQHHTEHAIQIHPKLLDKMQQIRLNLAVYLPQNYLHALDILLAVAPQFPSLNGIVFGDYVQAYGLHHWQPSVAALAEFTQYSTAEFAIRTFMLANPERTFQSLATWAEHDNYHVRRLASEGSRPRLPWAKALPQLKMQPQPIIPILEKLKADPSLYVRKSVANNINDISKDHPELVLNLASKWYNFHPHTNWILNHGCRTLLKHGERRALSLFNWETPQHLELLTFTITTATVKMGDSLIFNADFSLQQPTQLRIEYAIEWLRAHNVYQRKIFQIKRGTFSVGKHTVQKTQKIVPMTTRKYYPGTQKISLIINGQTYATQTFELL